jgi:hypothetical protein
MDRAGCTRLIPSVNSKQFFLGIALWFNEPKNENVKATISLLAPFFVPSIPIKSTISDARTSLTW